MSMGLHNMFIGNKQLFQMQQAIKKKLLEQKQYNKGSQNTNTLNIPLGEEEALGPTLPEHHHHISKKVFTRSTYTSGWPTIKKIHHSR
jgi:hypothetical protein